MDADKVLQEIISAKAPAFDRMELLKTYPEPVSRYLRYHLPKGIPDSNYGEVRLRGIIKLVNWSNFKSTLYTDPFRGFLWKARVKMGVLPVSGYDFFMDQTGEMSWRMFNLFKVMKSGGPDVSRSAEGRARMEAIFAPHLLINPKVKWEVISGNEITASWKIHQEDQPVRFIIGDDGALKEVSLKRWGNPGDSKEFGYHTFGSHIESETFYHGVVIPKKGHAGWWYGEEAYRDGEFFRFTAY